MGTLSDLFYTPDDSDTELDLPEHLSAEEKTIIKTVISKDTYNLTAKQIMSPRADILALHTDASLNDVKTAFDKYQTVLPVFGNSLDELVGVVYINDILALDSAKFRLIECLQPPNFISPAMRLFELIFRMCTDRLDIVFVIDEFGGIDGFITKDHLMAALLNNIDDSIYENAALAPVIQENDDGSFTTDGRTFIQEVRERIGDLTDGYDIEDNVHTIGGFVCDILGKVPCKDEIVKIKSGFEVKILDADLKRIKKLVIQKQ